MRVFLSYSTVDTEFIKRLYDRIQRLRPDWDIWYDQAPHGLLGGDSWWDEILKAIAEADIFIYVMTNESIQSKYCQAEFEEARRLQKRIITIQARDRTKLTGNLADIQYVDMKDGLENGDAVARLGGALARQAKLVKKRRPLWQPKTPKPQDEPIPARSTDAPDVDTLTLEISRSELARIKTVNKASTDKPRWKQPRIVGVLMVGLALLAVIAFVVLNRPDDGEPPPTMTNVAQGGLEIATASATEAATLDIIATAEELKRQQTVQAIITEWAVGTTTRDALNLTATATLWTATPTTTLTKHLTPVTRNADWAPIEREFDDGVVMVLVPVGCFMMGSNQNSFEQPIHERCFDTPFWIDKTEVTQDDFARLGGVQATSSYFSGDNRPVERITWFEAGDFCALRGGRLPTEVEWEYAARGVESWVYPWGNTWNANNVIWNRNSSQGTANVGRIPAGASWVGALDMSGNVWEWTSSRSARYPYRSDDGRETDPENRNAPVIRGGSWNFGSDVMRASNRDGNDPTTTYDSYGFRCARSY